MIRFFLRLPLLSGSLLAGALLAELPAAAQDVTITNLGRSEYRGFKTVDGQCYYLLRPYKTYYQFQLEVYGRDLQKKATTDLPLERGWYQGAARVVGDYTVFYFFTGKEGLLLALNAAGQKVKEVRFPASAVYGSQVVITPATGGDFYLTYPVDKDKDGYVVARYGADLTTKWQKEYAPEKGKYRVRFFQANAANVYAVVDYSKAGWEVVCLDGATGAEKSHKDLPGEVARLAPGFASLDPAGRLLLAGTYAEPQTAKTPFITSNTPSPTGPPTGGLFTLSLTPEGQPELNRMSYAQDLAGKLNTRSTLQAFTVGEVPAVKLHALVPRPGGGYTLLGETYKIFRSTDQGYEAAGGVRAPGTGTVGPGPLRRDILDFVVFQFTPQGKLESLRRIPKPYKAYSEHTGAPDEFVSATAYAYRFLYPRDPAKLPELVFLNWHQNLLYVNSLKPDTDVRDNLFTRRYLDQVAVPEAADRGELTVRDFTDVVNAPADQLYFDEVLPHAPGKLVYSHYDPAKSALHLQVLDVPGK